MIYFDNAATTFPKPEVVYKALDEANRKLAFNAGRGDYKEAKNASRIIQETREKIANLVNEAKDQLMQIAGMNGSIISDTDDYEVETKGISNAVERIGKLYNALNFEYIKTVSLNDLKDIITILLRPTLLISNSTMNIEESESFVIEHNASDIIYFIIESVELLAKDCKNNIKIKIQKQEENTIISIEAENFENKDFSNLELLTNESKFEIANNSITIIF